MIWEKVPRPFFTLAPMDDVTDTVFRRIIASTATPDLFYTEFASVDGFMSEGRPAVEEKLAFTSAEEPLIAQIWGLEPTNYKAVARELVSRGFAGVDINMGCPQRKIIKNGACGALMNNRQLAQDIIAATKEGLDGELPISVKTRIGFSEIDLSWTDFLLRQSIDALVVHGRTVTEMSSVPNHWDVVGEVVRQRDAISPSTIIVGNGDILSRQQAVELAANYGLDGVMIGRGIFQDPYVFSSNSPWSDMRPSQKLQLYIKHINLFIRQWGESRNPATLKKFAKMYISGFDGASSLRQAVMECDSAQDMREHLRGRH